MDSDDIRTFRYTSRPAADLAQLELLERAPFPEFSVDGWEIEHVEGDMLHIVFYTKHTRDDGEIIHLNEVRFVIPSAIWEKAMRGIEKPGDDTLD